MRPMIPRLPLPQRTRPLGKIPPGGLRIVHPRHHRDRKLQQNRERIRRHLSFPQPERPGNGKIRHRIGARIGADRHRDPLPVPERQHPVHELPARGMTENPIPLPRRHPRVTQRVEQPRHDPISPLFARIESAILIVHVAEMITQIIRKPFFREFDGDDEQTELLSQWQPVIPVRRAIAPDTVMHEQNRRHGRMTHGPRRVQIQGTVRKRLVMPEHGAGARLGHQRPQLCWLDQAALATARPAMTPTRCARYSELAWMSPFRSLGGVFTPLIAAAEKVADSAFSISA